MSNIADGIYTRWNDASLDTSVAKLFRGDWAEMGVDSTPISDANSALPRAEFGLGPDVPFEETVDYRIRQAPVRFKVWDTGMATVEGFLDTIESNMDDSDRAVTNPLTVSGGNVVDFMFEAREAYRLTKNLYVGYVDFSLMWTKRRVTPA